MGIYIKGMQIPGSCNLCPFEFSGDCLLDHDIICTFEPVTRSGDCPLIPVPDHGDLIDLGAVNLSDGPYEYADWVEWALQQYQDAPTVVPADREGEA